jgi:hypothetical protein
MKILALLFNHCHDILQLPVYCVCYVFLEFTLGSLYVIYFLFQLFLEFFLASASGHIKFPQQLFLQFFLASTHLI